jgi:2-haloacid dehalogenase
MEDAVPYPVIVFDAYGTLFDVAGAARMAAVEAPALAAVWPKLAADWRAKQLEYTWLRAIMGDHRDFAGVTADALDWAMAAHRVDPALRARLLALYDDLPAYPEVPTALAALATARKAILSNGTPAMLARACGSAGIAQAFEALISVEDAGVYKPATAVYDLVGARMGVAPDRVMFISSNGWDVAGAARYGFSTVWVNRAGLPVDQLSHKPAHIIGDLTELPALWSLG